MTAPMVYWGGKGTLAPRIADLIDNAGEHSIYLEPFAGSAAVFFARRFIPPMEILNDKGGAVTAFWRQIQESPSPIIDKLERCVFSQQTFSECKEMIDNPEGVDRADLAFALFFCSNTAYGANISRGQISTAQFSKDSDINAIAKNQSKRDSMYKKGWAMRDAQARIQRATITSKDAVQMINSLDSPQTVVYADPPYLGTSRGAKDKADQGHYTGWTEADHDRLLAALKAMKGKFVLSEYAHPKILALAKEQGWHVDAFDMPLSSSTFFNGRKLAAKQANAQRKQEFIIRNFTPRYMESLRRKVIIAGGKKILLPPK